MTGLPGNPVVDSVAMAAVVTYLLALVKPFLESLPVARPGAPAHDATLRAANLALNLVAVLLLAAQNGQLSGQTWLSLVLVGLAQSVGAHALYTTTTATAHAPAPRA